MPLNNPLGVHGSPMVRGARGRGFLRNHSWYIAAASTFAAVFFFAGIGAFAALDAAFASASAFCHATSVASYAAFAAGKSATIRCQRSAITAKAGFDASA